MEPAWGVGTGKGQEDQGAKEERERKKGRRVNVSVLLLLLGVTIAVVGQLLLKTGMNQVGRIGTASFANPVSLLVRVGSNPIVLAGLALYIFSAALWLIVLSREQLSYVYPLIGTSYLLVVLLGKFYFHEQVGLMRWVGVALIGLGVILVTRS